MARDKDDKMSVEYQWDPHEEKTDRRMKKQLEAKRVQPGKARFDKLDDTHRSE